MTCLLVNDTIALDAGSLTQSLTLERQQAIHSILITHSHVDHTSSLPFLVENTRAKGPESIDIYGSRATLYTLRRNMFNDTSWPDFGNLPNHLTPSIQFKELQNEVPITIEDVKFTPFSVNHVVPTFGFLIQHQKSSVLWSSDTGPAVRLWELANFTANLKAVCVDTSFDNSLQALADVSLHLTPQTLREELQQLDRDIPVLLQHLKPWCREQIYSEVAALDLPNVSFLEQGKAYEF
jgi:ribonuclease BN (tRNA processing enzyme)